MFKQDYSLKMGVLQLKVHTSELLNLSVEIMNSIVKNIIELLQGCVSSKCFHQFS